MIVKSCNQQILLYNKIFIDMPETTGYRRYQIKDGTLYKEGAKTHALVMEARPDVEKGQKFPLENKLLLNLFGNDFSSKLSDKLAAILSVYAGLGHDQPGYVIGNLLKEFGVSSFLAEVENPDIAEEGGAFFRAQNSVWKALQKGEDIKKAIEIVTSSQQLTKKQLKALQRLELGLRITGFASKDGHDPLEKIGELIVAIGKHYPRLAHLFLNHFVAEDIAAAAKPLHQELAKLLEDLDAKAVFGSHALGSRSLSNDPNWQNRVVNALIDTGNGYGSEFFSLLISLFSPNTLNTVPHEKIAEVLKKYYHQPAESVFVFGNICPLPDTEEIIKKWSNPEKYRVILTTGGSGSHLDEIYQWLIEYREAPQEIKDKFTPIVQLFHHRDELKNNHGKSVGEIVELANEINMNQQTQIEIVRAEDNRMQAITQHHEELKKAHAIVVKPAEQTFFAPGYGVLAVMTDPQNAGIHEEINGVVNLEEKKAIVSPRDYSAWQKILKKNHKITNLEDPFYHLPQELKDQLESPNNVWEKMAKIFEAKVGQQTIYQGLVEAPHPFGGFANALLILKILIEPENPDQFSENFRAAFAAYEQQKKETIRDLFQQADFI